MLYTRGSQTGVHVPLCLSEGVHLRLAIEWKIYVYTFHFLFIHMNLTELFHVTNWVRQEGMSVDSMLVLCVVR